MNSLKKEQKDLYLHRSLYWTKQIKKNKEYSKQMKNDKFHKRVIIISMNFHVMALSENEIIRSRELGFQVSQHSFNFSIFVISLSSI